MIRGQQRIVLEALRGGETVSVDQLVQMLYGHCAAGGPDHPAAVVHTIVLRLKKRLEVHAITLLAVGRTRALEGYCIAPEDLLRLYEVEPIEPIQPQYPGDHGDCSEIADDCSEIERRSAVTSTEVFASPRNIR